MATHQIYPRQDEQEQRIIENNVNKIMRGIFRIIFNKWVVYTHHQVKFQVQPKETAAVKLIGKIDSIMRQKKVEALTKIHLYHLSIEKNDQSVLIERNVNNKLKNNNIALFIIKALISKKDTNRVCRKFNSWKFKVVMFEWRMNQSMQSNMNTSDHQSLQKVFQ